MKKLNPLKLFFIAGLSLFLNTNVSEKTLPPLDVKFYDLDALKIERLEAINNLQEDTVTSNFLKNLEEDKNYSNFKDSVIKEDKKDLEHLIKKYEKIKLSQKRYISKGIYQEFIESNEKISESKSKVDNYQIVSIGGLLHLKNLNSYTQNDNLNLILKDLKKVQKLEEISKNSESQIERSMGSTILNVSEYIPFINELSKKENLPLESNLTIISNESSGYPYIVGRTGDLNLFQINPLMIPNLYKKMKNEKDTFFQNYVNKISLEEFEKEIKFNPKTNIVTGIYLLKLLNKESKNEAQRIILYHLGEPSYKEIPLHVRKKIESGYFNSEEKIKESDEKYPGLGYLKYYFSKKKALCELEKTLLD